MSWGSVRGAPGPSPAEKGEGGWETRVPPGPFCPTIPSLTLLPRDGTVTSLAGRVMFNGPEISFPGYSGGKGTLEPSAQILLVPG